MRSMFVSAPFSRFDLGRYAFRGGMGLPRVGLGQASAYALEDYFQKIENITDKETRDKLKTKLKECQDKEGTAQAICFVSLANDIYQASRRDSSTPVPLPAVVPQSKVSSFPILPVAVATLAAAGLIWFLVSRGKK